MFFTSLVQQYSRSLRVRGSAKVILLSKFHLPQTVTQCCIPPEKNVNWIHVRNWDMSLNESYPSCYSNDLYESLHHGFMFSLMWFITTHWANLSLPFALGNSIISYLNYLQQFFHQQRKNHMTMNRTQNHSSFPENIQLNRNMYWFFFALKFVWSGGTSKGPSSDS